MQYIAFYYIKYLFYDISRNGEFECQKYLIKDIIILVKITPTIPP